MIQCEWGSPAVVKWGARSDILIVVDVLSFSTSVDVAVGRGVEVYPFAYADTSASEFATAHGAVLASRRSLAKPSLSPSSLRSLEPGSRLVLPSPNGSTVTLHAAEHGTVVAGCLRNASAVARFAMSIGGKITVIPCGERWPDGGLRPAIEDWLGAGAIISNLAGELSPEAQSAVAGFRQMERSLAENIRTCMSGRELIDGGFRADVDLATELNASANVSVLKDGRYVGM